MTGVSKLDELIEAERQAQPESTAVQRGWERLDAAVTGGLPPPTPGVEATGVLKLSGATSLGKLIGVCAIGGSVAVGGVTWTWMELRPGATEPRAHAASVAASSRPASQDRNLSGTKSSERVSPEGPAAFNADPPGRVDRDDIGPGSEQTNGRAKPSQRASSHPAASESTFEEELALIKQAKADLDSNRATSALRRLNEHGARFPRGVFASEREALRILARCASGASPSSRSLAERFVRAHPRSPLVDRVSRACGLQKSKIAK
jgi:hypothetical protein